LRFSSHRDFSRAFERALVRARVPMAYSSGFNPHPRISYAGAAPTGSASEAEYVEIGLAQECDPDDVRARLDAALPPGLDVLEAVVSSGGSLSDRLEASIWHLTLRDVSAEQAAAAVRAFLAAEEIEVERMTKRGLRTFDCRGAVAALSVVESGPAAGECAILRVVLRHGVPSVRPDDVLAGLREVSGVRVGAAATFERVAQGTWDEKSGTVGDPLKPDRDVV
jgi:radical SAM-linked protein